MSTQSGVVEQFAQLGVPWEEAYGYAQAVKVGNTIYISGQLSHDERGQLVGPAVVDDAGKIIDSSNMALQMRTTYENAERVLAQFGANLDNVVAEVIYATDFQAAFVVAGQVRKAAYGKDRPLCTSTIVGTTRLAFPQQLVEISFTAVV
ncbi:hypothetical protein JM946_20200 [Steroidobacter sp. S1-65]|uniref:RidA family protein n=1 Tax=Steroidobacter gossypii TaxID=2805490 RepID=A0ABS1X1G0_9GAMM|nr:Rid family hydrolase [Steroidobacter gossypii]MBM0107065.1 hypothetical protein [Steroidobacter gossypii]